MTGKIPYPSHSDLWTVMNAIVKKEHPVDQEDRGVLEGNGLISLLKDCWQYDAKKRPEIGEVYRRL